VGTWKPENMLSESTEFIIGSSVSCSDGPCGDLTCVVVDPAARTVTHLIVKPPQRDGTRRLVPVRLATTGPAAIQLRCTLAQFEGLRSADETQTLPGALGELPDGQDHKLSAPYYGRGGMGLAMAVGTGLGSGTAPREITSDRIPAGKVGVHRGDHVHATDGPIGKVQGLAILTRGHNVTRILLDEGHLWGKHRVAVPISAVADFSDGVRLSLTKDEVRDLPSADLTPGED
jgi:hypothetical protein